MDHLFNPNSQPIIQIPKTPKNNSQPISTPPIPKILIIGPSLIINKIQSVSDPSPNPSRPVSRFFFTRNDPDAWKDDDVDTLHPESHVIPIAYTLTKFASTAPRDQRCSFQAGKTPNVSFPLFSIVQLFHQL